LPDVMAGPQYNRHDGEIQNSTGLVFATNKWNFFIGGGAALQWDTPNLLFGPLIARRLQSAQAAAAQATSNRVQLDVVMAYLDLLHVYGQLAVNADTLARAGEMLRTADAAAKANAGKTQADLTRAETEIALRTAERIDLTGQAAVASARLARLLLLDPTVDLVPADCAVLPIVLVSPEQPLSDLLSAAFANRPELAEGQALAGAAQARWRQAKVAPFIPKIGVGYMAGGFGGGIDDELQAFRGRGDGVAMATWELHGLGFGDVATAKARRSQFDQVMLQNRDLEAQVAEEVTVAARVAASHQSALDVAAHSVKKAEKTWDIVLTAARNLAFPDKRYDPLEPLTAEQALDTARTRYLNEVIQFNRAQFQLYWAMGQPPASSLPCATTIPLDVPPAPEVRKPAEGSK
jgi:outer membrane protein TolC